MRELLSSGALGLVLLGEILRNIQGLESSLGKQTLTTQEGVNEALKIQGQIIGLNRVVDTIFDIAERTE